MSCIVIAMERQVNRMIGQFLNFGDVYGEIT